MYRTKTISLRRVFTRELSHRLLANKSGESLAFYSLALYIMFNAAAAICSGEGSKPLTQMKHEVVNLIGKVAIC